MRKDDQRGAFRIPDEEENEREQEKGFHRKPTKVADESAGNRNISNASLNEGI
jgi:hypothetical protein